MSRIRADQLINRAGSGGPKFPNGVAEGFSVSGVVTATSYRGDGSQLTGIDASSLKDGSDVKVQAVSGGANVTGNVAATGNVSAVDVTASGNVSAVDGTFSGNLTVNGTTTTIDTAVTSVDSLAVDGSITALGSVGIGTDNPQSLLSLHQSGGGFEVNANSGSNNARLLSYDRSASVYREMTLQALSYGFETSGSEKLRITSTGNIGIGTLNPGVSDATLDIKNEEADIKLGNPSGHYFRFKSLSNGDFTINDNDVAERFRITSGGTILPGADNTQDLGSSSKRFANLYTGDLNLSNEGSANDVDGTWGQYTIQEGEDDLFLINRRTGKKYKFNLTEV